MGTCQSAPQRPHPAAALLALLADCDTTAATMLAALPNLAALTGSMAARGDDSQLSAASRQATARFAAVLRKSRALGSCKRAFRQQYKRAVAELEALGVSTGQLRVWAAAVECPAIHDPALDVALSLPLLASPQHVHVRAIGLGIFRAPSFAGELGSVVIGDGLRVVRAAGPGLKWLKPHSRNEFSVVLAQADGSVPVWLTAGDVGMTVLSTVDDALACTSTVTAVPAAAGSTGGTVAVAYEVFGGDDPPEVRLQLTVCGVGVGDTGGPGDWGVAVRRRPLAGHECAAKGTHVGTLDVVEGRKHALAVSADEQWLVVGLYYEGTLFVYSLPGGELARTFGGRGSEPLQFRYLYRLCFALNGNLIVVDTANKRLQEVTLEGVFVRFIGVGEFVDGHPCCVAVHNDVIAVACVAGTAPRVLLLDFNTGAVTSRFGEVGTGPGQLSAYCACISFSLHGSHVIVAGYEGTRLSLFTTAGVFVRCVGEGVLGAGSTDVVLSAKGEYVVVDRDHLRVCVFSPDGSRLVRRWGVGAGKDVVMAVIPSVLYAAGIHLYAMDQYKVQVFE